jgi:hypothetical protein
MSIVHIRHKTETLTDGSKVHNLDIGLDGFGLVLHCTTERDAWTLATVLKVAIDKHATEEAQIHD